MTLPWDLFDAGSDPVQVGSRARRDMCRGGGLWEAGSMEGEGEGAARGVDCLVNRHSFRFTATTPPVGH